MLDRIRLLANLQVRYQVLMRYWIALDFSKFETGQFRLMENRIADAGGHIPVSKCGFLYRYDLALNFL